MLGWLESTESTRAQNLGESGDPRVLFKDVHKSEKSAPHFVLILPGEPARHADPI